MSRTLPAGQRFVNFRDGRGVVDTQMDPKVLKAQEESEQRRTGVGAAVKGFSYPSQLDTEIKKKEEA